MSVFWISFWFWFYRLPRNVLRSNIPNISIKAHTVLENNVCWLIFNIRHALVITQALVFQFYRHVHFHVRKPLTQKQIILEHSSYFKTYFISFPTQPREFCFYFHYFYSASQISTLEALIGLKSAILRLWLVCAHWIPITWSCTCGLFSVELMAVRLLWFWLAGSVRSTSRWLRETEKWIL